jgi:hypothetical protein
LFVEINEVNGFAVPQTRLAGKHQLRGTLLRSRVRSKINMKEMLSQVQRKKFIALIG